MAKRSEKPRRKLQLCFIAACLAFAFISVKPSMAQNPLDVSDPNLTIIMEAPQPKYLSPEQIKEMRDQGMTSPAPMQPKIIPLEPGSPFLLEPKPLTKSPSEAGVSTPSRPMGMLAGTSAGKTIFVYDGLNRLTRVINGNKTLTYTYDKVGNRLTKKSGYAGVTCDFNNDEKTDLLWRHKTTGDNAVWLMNGVTYMSTVFVLNVSDTNWKIVGADDFNSDGKTDILWHHTPTGTVAIWLMDGITWTVTVIVGGVPDTSWKIVGTGDFNNDGKTDILWHHATTGTIAIWLMDGTTYESVVVVGVVADVNWKIVGTGDFNTDGQTDILWWHAGTGEIYVWLIDGPINISAVAIGVVSDVNWKIMGAGDFDADGRPDILWHHATAGTIAIWLMDGTTYVSTVIIGAVTDLNWEIVAP